MSEAKESHGFDPTLYLEEPRGWKSAVLGPRPSLLRLVTEIAAWLVIGLGFMLSPPIPFLGSGQGHPMIAAMVTGITLASAITAASLRWFRRWQTWRALDRHGREVGLTIDLVVGGSRPRDRIYIDTRRMIALSAVSGPCLLDQVASVETTVLRHVPFHRRLWGYLVGWSDIGCDSLPRRTHALWLRRGGNFARVWPKAEFGSAGEALWAEWQIKRLMSREGAIAPLLHRR